MADTRLPTPTDSALATPPLRHADGETPPKMKGTCDRCALSKVKCDRQLPECGRCVQIGTELGIPPPCHYTVSLRSLRKSASRKQSGSASRRTSKARYTRPENLLSLYPGDSDSISTSSTPELGQSPALRPSATSTPSFDQTSYFDLDMASDMGSTDSYFAPQAHMMSYPMPHGHEAFADSQLYTGFLSPASSSFATPTGALGESCLPGPTSGAGQCHGQGWASCADLICFTVHELWQASKSSRCLSTQAIAPQAMDEALVLNRTASDAVATVMKCSCAKDPEFFFNAAFLLHSIIGFFRTIVKNSLNPQLPAEAQQQYHPSMRHDSPNLTSAPPTSPKPLRLGVFTVDAEDEHRFKTHILRSELAKISKLIDDFVAKYCARDGVDGRGTNQPPQPELLKYCLSMEMKQCLDELDQRGFWP